MPKISNLPAASSVGSADLFAIVQSNVTKKATASLVLSYISANITFDAANITGIVSLAHGGTNANLTATSNALVYCDSSSFALLSPSNSGVLLSNSSGVPTWSGTMTNGQVIIGSTGSIPVAANLVGSSGVSITNGAGTITISGSGSGIGWNNVTATSATMSPDSGYVANNAGLVTLTLPTIAAFGTAISVIGLGAGGWTIAQNASQTIHIGNVATTVGGGGSVSSTNQYDSVNLICVVANTTWVATGGVQGALTIV